MIYNKLYMERVYKEILRQICALFQKVKLAPISCATSLYCYHHKANVGLRSFYDKILTHCVQKAFEYLVEITLSTFCLPTDEKSSN